MHGDKKIWTTAELKDAGWGEARTRRALGDTLHRVVRGVYTTTMDTDVVLRALALAHPGIVFTGRTAAYLHYALPWSGLRRRVARRGDTTTTSSPSAAVDQVRVLERGYSGFRGTENFEKDAAHLSRTGRRRLAAIRSKAIIGTASNLETQAVQLIRSALRPELEAGLITIETNAMVRGYCWDIMIPEVRLLIEIDSWAYHGEAKAKRMDFARDRCKGNQATRWGYLLLRYPDSAVKHAPHWSRTRWRTRCVSSCSICAASAGRTRRSRPMHRCGSGSRRCERTPVQGRSGYLPRGRPLYPCLCDDLA